MNPTKLTDWDRLRHRCCEITAADLEDMWIDPFDKPDPILDEPFSHSLGRELAEIERLRRAEDAEN